MATNYTGVDLDRYNAGNKFYSQDRYLQGTGLDKPAITFNPSRLNTGIMSAYNPYPIIPQYDGGGDGGGPINPGGPGYGYTSPGGNLNPDGSFKNIDDFGEGTIPEEDMPKGPGLSFMDMVRAGGAFMFTGPFGAANSLRRSNNRNEQVEIDKINADINAQYGDNSLVPGGGTWDGGSAAYTDPSTGTGGGQFTDSLGNTDYQDAYDPGGGEKDGGFIDGSNRRAGYSGEGLSKYEVFKLGELGYNTKGGKILEPFGGINVLRDILKVNKYAYGGRAGYKEGGYSSEDNEEQQAQDQASFDAGNRTDDYNDMYSGDDNTPNQNPFYEPTGTSNLDFTMVKDVNPAFSYANNVGRFGGMLDTTRTIQEEEPVGNMGYFSPSGNFGIGLDTNKGIVSNANLGNLNIGYTGQDGFNANYMGGFDGDAGRFGANYGKDGLEARITYNKKFNNGGIVGMYR